MDGNLRRRVALAVLAVLALGAVAATIDTAVVTQGGDVGVGAPADGGVGTGDADAVGLDSPGGGGALVASYPCLTVLNDPRVLGAVALLALAGGYLLYRRLGSVLPPVAIGVAFGIPAALIHQLLTACGRASSGSRVGTGAPGNASFPFPEGGGGALGEAAGTVSAPSALFGLLLLVALVGSLALLVAGTGDDEDDAPPTDPDPDEVDVAAVGRAAGEAADRIEDDADVDNEVYRAWAEMTEHLDVANPRSSTPAEFADAAVAAGMVREDVAELTDLFEAVRYGGAAATADRERRAVAALRRIEAAYAGEDGP